jgi:hypothetical protein
MAIKKYTCPPQSATGAGTFSDNLVGLQLVAGGGLTQGNFEFTTSTNEKTNRTFNTGTFSEPINLNSLGIESINQSKTIVENNFKVYPNFDLTQVTNFTMYGSMVKRMSASITTIISYFPGALESTFMGTNYITGPTANNILYSKTNNETSFDLDLSRLRNPFDIDFTVNSTRNLQLKEIQVSSLRDMRVEYLKYSLYYKGVGYNVVGIVPTTSLTSGTLKLYVYGNPFSGKTFTNDDLVIRPNDLEVNKVFNENLDEVENFLLNRNVSPKYTATFKVPKEAEDGSYYIQNTNISWPLYGEWNIDIITKSFETYITTINNISESFDLYRTNLVSRFLTTGAFKEFDTPDQKVEKVLQIYGKSFDDVKKYITALSYMTSVNYNVGNDIPSQLLKNLAQTLGWNINISPISETELLTSVFGTTNNNASVYPGISQQQTPDELNYQYYRNLILNSAFLFKSKGTRKSIEILMRLIGAPEALVEFNEYVYLADQKINLSQFDTQFAQISGGTYVQQIPILEAGNIFSIFGQTYTGFTTTGDIQDVNITLDEYPMDEYGYPTTPINSESYFFQMGSGWFEQTPQHRAPENIDLTNSVFVGNNPNYQTVLLPYSYGQEYLNRYRKFPFMDLGYTLRETIDNNKSWVNNEIGIRTNLDGNFNARYYVSDERLVLNVKNVDLFLNPAQGIAYDIWYMSQQYNYPIPNEGLNYVPPTPCDPKPYSPYPSRGGVDWTEINPQPKRKTFFEFAQTFWLNTINVRNRQYSSNGKTGGYPTLESIFWRYLQSNETIGIPNDNFTYKTMMEYVNGLGDYWIRLVEQMVPATTIWNTGVRLENSIFHRQKFVWRRQEGCQLIKIPCKPCSITSGLFSHDCPLETVECPIYPWTNHPTITTFNGVLGQLMTNYLTANGYNLNDCDFNGMTSEWFVDLQIDNVTVVKYPFFNGIGYSSPIYSVPTGTTYNDGLLIALESLKDYGYDYYLTTTDTVVLSNQVCTVSEQGINFKLNIGINFNILCN